MKYLLTNEQMRKADEFAMQTTPSLVLMERAGAGLAKRVEEIQKELHLIEVANIKELLSLL